MNNLKTSLLLHFHAEIWLFTQQQLSPVHQTQQACPEGIHKGNTEGSG